MMARQSQVGWLADDRNACYTHLREAKELHRQIAGMQSLSFQAEREIGIDFRDGLSYA